MRTRSIRGALGIAARDALQLLAASEGRCWSRSTTSSGSTPRRQRARVRAATARGEPRARCCSPGGSASGAQPSRLEQALGAGARRAAAGGTAQRRRAPPAAARPARHGRSRARRCSASTSGRAAIRSSRSSWPASLDADVDPLQPLPVPETLEELVRARLSGLPAPTREALALASALGTPSESLLERAGVAADALEPALAAHVIERENGTIRFTHPLLSSVLYRRPGRGAAERSRADRRDRRRPAPPRPSPRALDGRAGRRGRRACSTTPRGSRPIAARRRSRPSSPSRRSG